MWLKESCVASVRCHYGGHHTPSPAADIKAILPTARPLQATVTVRQPWKILAAVVFQPHSAEKEPVRRPRRQGSLLPTLIPEPS